MSNILDERPLIKTSDELRSLCGILKEAGIFGLDTEFFNERTYTPRLCLVQVSTESFIALIDGVAISDFSPLWELVCDPKIVKVLHAAREDLRLAYYGHGKRVPANIFDTQVAAGFAGLPFYPASYARLAEGLEGVKLSKSETRSDWERRPLTADQISYARDDVRYLLPMREKLSRVLQKTGRLNWLFEEMKKYEQASLYETVPDEAYLKIRLPRNGLSRRPLGALQVFAAWREREAALCNVPPRTLLRDEVLLELALRPPYKMTDLLRIKGIAEDSARIYGSDLLAEAERFRKMPDEALPVSSGADELKSQERIVANLLHAIGESLCQSKKIASELLFARSDAAALARGEREGGALSGWRREAIGEELEALLEGRSRAEITFANAAAKVVLISQSASGAMGDAAA